jgi:arylsulfatase A-like enzyme
MRSIGHRLPLRWLLSAVFAVLVGSTAVGRQPNIVVFLTDDLGATDLGCFGSKFYETPHLDRLAAGGMRFTAAYSACPVCSPTRASMMTGRYPQRSDVTNFIGAKQPKDWDRNTRLLPAPYATRMPLEDRTIAEELHDAGYATFFAGKWHLGEKGFLPTDQGFDVNKGGSRAGSPKSYFSPYSNPQLPDGPPGEELSMRLADEACQFIDAHADGPFFVYVSLFAVHVPLQASAQLIEKYTAKAKNLGIDESWGRERNSKVRLVQSHPVYSGMIESMDAAVGRVLDKLEELKLNDDTIVIFTSDNGGLSTAEGWSTSNLPLRGGKGWLYEGGIRTPTIIRWPGVATPGSTCATPIISNDYFPTLLEAAEMKRDSARDIDGVSLVPLLHGKTIKPRTLYWDYPHYGNQGGSPASAIRDGHWKLIEWHEDNADELYDLNSDPGEKNDVAQQNPDVVKRLRDALATWRRNIGAKSTTLNPRFQARSK